MDIKEALKHKRPNLSNSSLTTYSSILKNLHKRVFEDKPIAEDDFRESDRILHFLRDVPPNKRKTTLSALVVLTNLEPYRQQMNADVSAYNAEISKQVKTETQRENWVETPTIQSKLTSLSQDAKNLYKKSNPSNQNLQDIQNYIIVALLGGQYIPPRRSLDYCKFKIKNVDEDKDNYLKGNKLVFNAYKTAKTYGRQEVTIPVALRNILKKWISINPTDYLLFDNNHNELSSVKLNQRINRIFDGKVAVNALRHTYLTDKYKKTSEENKALAEDLTQMGSSTNVSTNYIKLK